MTSALDRLTALRAESAEALANKADPFPSGLDAAGYTAWAEGATTRGKRAGRYTRIARWADPLAGEMLPLVAGFHNGVINWFLNLSSLDCPATEPLLDDLAVLWEQGRHSQAVLQTPVRRDGALFSLSLYTLATKGHLERFPRARDAVRRAAFGEPSLVDDAGRRMAAQTLLRDPGLGEADLLRITETMLGTGEEPTYYLRYVVRHRGATEAVYRRVAQGDARGSLPISIVEALARRRRAVTDPVVRSSLVDDFVQGWPDLTDPHAAHMLGRLFSVLWRALPASDRTDLDRLIARAITVCPAAVAVAIEARTSPRVRGLSPGVLSGALASPDRDLRDAALRALAVARG